MITPHLRFSQMTSRDHVHATFSQKLRVHATSMKVAWTCTWSASKIRRTYFIISCEIGPSSAPYELVPN